MKSFNRTIYNLVFGVWFSRMFMIDENY